MCFSCSSSLTPRSLRRVYTVYLYPHPATKHNTQKNNIADSHEDKHTEILGLLNTPSSPPEMGNQIFKETAAAAAAADQRELFLNNL